MKTFLGAHQSGAYGRKPAVPGRNAYFDRYPIDVAINQIAIFAKHGAIGKHNIVVAWTLAQPSAVLEMPDEIRQRIWNSYGS